MILVCRDGLTGPACKMGLQDRRASGGPRRRRRSRPAPRTPVPPGFRKSRYQEQILLEAPFPTMSRAHPECFVLYVQISSSLSDHRMPGGAVSPVPTVILRHQEAFPNLLWIGTVLSRRYRSTMTLPPLPLPELPGLPCGSDARPCSQPTYSARNAPFVRFGAGRDGYRVQLPPARRGVTAHHQREPGTRRRNAPLSARQVHRGQLGHTKADIAGRYQGPARAEGSGSRGRVRWRQTLQSAPSCHRSGSSYLPAFQLRSGH